MTKDAVLVRTEEVFKWKEVKRMKEVKRRTRKAMQGSRRAGATSEKLPRTLAGGNSCVSPTFQAAIKIKRRKLKVTKERNPPACSFRVVEANPAVWYSIEPGETWCPHAI